MTKPCKLSAEEIETRMQCVPGWKLHQGLLRRRFTFTDYLDGVKFAVRVAEKSEQFNRHPDLQISWRSVSVSFTTHSVGGLSILDFEAAAAVNEMVPIPK